MNLEKRTDSANNDVQENVASERGKIGKAQIALGLLSTHIISRTPPYADIGDKEREALLAELKNIAGKLEGSNN